MKQTVRPKIQRPCTDCNAPVTESPTVVDFDRQEIHVFHPVLCPSCLLAQCVKYSVECANCGGKIPPYSQVGVLKADDGAAQYVHMTTACSTVGSAFHGYFGKGTLGEFVQIEAC